ncbi:MAG: TetR family transcriptional regulator [Acidimicrobiia bacterium]
MAPALSRAEQTHQRIQEKALALITERGFDDVTVEEIAGAAGVSHMTFFRHFPTKEAVIVSDPYDPVIAEEVARQPRSLPPLERVRRGMWKVSEALSGPLDSVTRTRIEIGVAHPKLRAAMWENTHQTEQVIVEALVDSGVDHFEARVAAGACLGAVMAALLEWAQHPSGESLGGRVRRALEQLGPVSA